MKIPRRRERATSSADTSLQERLALWFGYPLLGFVLSTLFDLTFNKSRVYYRIFGFPVYLLKESVKDKGLFWTITSFRIPESQFGAYVYGRQPYFADYGVHALLDSVGIPTWFYVNFGVAIYVVASIFLIKQFLAGRQVYLYGLIALLPPIMMNDLLDFQNAALSYTLLLISLGLLATPSNRRLVLAGLVLGLVNFVYFTATWFVLSVLLAFAILHWRGLKMKALSPLLIVTALLVVFQPNNFLVFLNQVLPPSMRLPAIQGLIALQAVPIAVPALPPITATPLSWRHSALIPLYFLPFLMAIPFYALTILKPTLSAMQRRFRKKASLSVPERMLLTLVLASLIFLMGLFQVDMYGRLFNYLPLLLLPGIYLLTKGKPSSQKRVIIGVVLVAELMINVAYFSLPPNYIDYTKSEMLAVDWASTHLTGTIFVDVTRADLFYLRGYYKLQGPWGDTDPVIQITYYTIDNGNATRNVLRSRNATYILITDAMFVTGLVPSNIPTIPVPQGVLSKFQDTRYFVTIYSQDGSYIFSVR